MSRHLIDRDRFVYGWNPEMAKQEGLYEINLEETTAQDFEFPDSDNANSSVQSRVFATAVGDNPDEVVAEAQRKAAAGEPFVVRHEATITLVKEPDALLDMKPLASPHSLTQASDMDPKPEQDEAGNLKPEFNPQLGRPDQEDPRPGENAALLRGRGVATEDQDLIGTQANPREPNRPNLAASKRDDNLSDEEREKAAADRKARAQKIIDDAKSKKRGPQPDNSLPEDQGKNGDEG